MKNKKRMINTFEITIIGKLYHIEITNEHERAKKYYTNRIKIYSCKAYEVLADKELLIPLKHFDIIYSNSLYAAWTGDVIRDDDRTFRNIIADLLNDCTLKLVV